MRRGEPEPGGEGTGMSPRSARAAARGAAGAPRCPAERGPGRPPGAAGEGGDARGRKERDTREAAITHSLTATGEQPPRPLSPPLRAARSHRRWARHRPPGHRGEG